MFIFVTQIREKIVTPTVCRGGSIEIMSKVPENCLFPFSDLLSPIYATFYKHMILENLNDC